jgi:hypothetical protein
MIRALHGRSGFGRIGAKSYLLSLPDSAHPAHQDEPDRLAEVIGDFTDGQL